MKLSLNTNIGSLRAQNQLLKANEKLQTSFERLSSGLRINRASDDPAGLAMASGLQTDSRLMAQAVRNVNDGISLLTIAEGALKELNNILGRQAELAQQAANGVYTSTQRATIQKESDELTREYNRIVETTEYNNIQLLAQGSESIVLAAGSGLNDTVQLSLAGQLAHTVGTGTFTDYISYSVGPTLFQVADADFNNDGEMDLVIDVYGASSLSVLAGNGNGTFSPLMSFSTGGSPGCVEAADINADGFMDIISSSYTPDKVYAYLGNGNGTFTAGNSFVVGVDPTNLTIADFNNDGKLDVASVNCSDDSISFLLGNGNGTFSAQLSIATGGTSWRSKAAVGDLNNDGNLDFVVDQSGEPNLAVYLGNGDGTFKIGSVFSDGGAGSFAPYSALVADFDRDGNLDVAYGDWVQTVSGIRVRLGKGDGTFGDLRVFSGLSRISDASAADVNADGLIDLVGISDDNNGLAVWLGNGDGNFAAAQTYLTGADPYSVTVSDFNGDGISDIAVTERDEPTVSIYLGDTKKSSLATYLTLTDQASAAAALDEIETADGRVVAELGVIGAAQSRLSHTVNHLQIMRENYAAANSKIVDADIAEEVAQMVRQQILQQAVTAVMAQANQQSALVLELLK